MPKVATAATEEKESERDFPFAAADTLPITQSFPEKVTQARFRVA